MNIVEHYLSGLKTAYLNNEGKDIWEHFEKIKHGATNENIRKIKEIYPDTPDSLLGLLEYVDGTYWREYQGEQIAFFFLGSDIEEYPYYLLSSTEIIENKNKAIECFSDYIRRKYDFVTIDEKITDQPDTLKWLHFSDCMNNGGTSQLFIDFSPSEKGKRGQIVRFIHDPDELSVIADNFDDYLKNLIENEYNFINKDML